MFSPVESVTLVYKDSVRVETVEKVRIDTVRVEIPIPAETAMQIVRDSMSYLETAFAWSRAWVDADGTLGHRLENKKGVYASDVPIIGRDTEKKEVEYVYRDKPVPQPYAVEVERKISGWEKFRLDAFWWLTGGLLLSLLWIFRKRIFSFFS